MLQAIPRKAGLIRFQISDTDTPEEVVLWVCPFIDAFQSFLPDAIGSIARLGEASTF